MSEGAKTAGIVLGVVGIVCEAVSIFACWWLSIIGLVLGIVSLCLGSKVLGGIATGGGAIVLILEIVMLATVARMAGH